MGSASRESQITFAPANRGGAFVSDQLQLGAGHTTERIRVERLDDVFGGLGLDRVDFVKIDVEGFEMRVLEGARSSLARFPPMVVLELNHLCLNAFQRITVPDFFDYLRSVFPVALAVDQGRHLDLHHPDQSYAVMFGHINHLRFPNILAAFDRRRLDRFLAAFPNR